MVRRDPKNVYTETQNARDKGQGVNATEEPARDALNEVFWSGLRGNPQVVVTCAPTSTRGNYYIFHLDVRCQVLGHGRLQ